MSGTRTPSKILLRRCLVVNWSFDQKLGETYEYVLEIVDRPSRLGFPEGTLTTVCVHEQDKIEPTTDHSLIDSTSRNRAPSKTLLRRCLVVNWSFDQKLGRICNRRRYCSWTDTFFFLCIFKYLNNSQYFVFNLLRMINFNYLNNSQFFVLNL